MSWHWRPGRSWVFSTVLWALPLWGLAQTGTHPVSGVVVDAETSETIPFVAVQLWSLTDSTVVAGAVADLDGKFRLNAAPGSYRIAVVYASYRPLVMPLALQGPALGLRLALDPIAYTTQELTITAKDNPAKRLMKAVIANKNRHRMARFLAYSFSSYSKLVISFSNLDTADISDGILRRAKDLILAEGLDTSKTDSNTNRYKLALYLAETVSTTHYEQPNNRRDIIHGSRQGGVSNDVNLTFVNSLFQPFDIYEDIISIANRNFISPLADGALQNYEYFIEQAVKTPTDTTYYVGLYPKNPYDRAFKGLLVVHTHDMVVESATLRMNRDPLINFVTDIRIAQQYRPINGEWVQVASDIQVDLLEVFFGKAATARQAVYRRDYNLAPSYSANFFRNEAVALEAGAAVRDEAFWKANTLAPLEKTEQLAYKASDTLRKALFWKASDLALNFLMGGVLRAGKFMFGPYSKALGFNPVEGARFQLGIYTNPDYFPRLDANAYLAYGTSDRWKYHVDVGYALVEKPRVELALRRTDDIEQTGFDNYFAEGLGFLNSALMRVPLENLNYFTLNQARLSVDATTGVALGLSVTQKEFVPAPTFPFEYPAEGDAPVEQADFTAYTTNEVLFSARLSIRERYILKGGKKVYLRSPFPVLYLKYGLGVKDWLGADFGYNRFDVALTNRYSLGRFGRITWVAQAGYIRGDLPFPSLRVFQGSQSWGGYTLGQASDIASSVTGRINRTTYPPAVNYNMLYFYEFVADRYVQAGFDWFLDGYLIKKLPLVRLLKVKEVITFRTGWGSLTAANRERNAVAGLPLQAPDRTPYTEMAIGVEGILKIIRVDYAFRLNYRNPQVPSNLPANANFNSGFRFGLKVAF